MIVAVCRRKLRVVMYTGLGRPVDPDVKLTNPGHAKNGTDPSGTEGVRGEGSTRTVRPGARCAPRSPRQGGMKSGVSAGASGSLRHARGSGG
jgi:hypothetical protein